MEPDSQLVCASGTLPVQDKKDATLVSIQNPIRVDDMKEDINKPGIIPLRKEGDGRATQCPESPPSAEDSAAAAQRCVIADGARSSQVAWQKEKEKGRVGVK